METKREARSTSTELWTLIDNGEWDAFFSLLESMSLEHGKELLDSPFTKKGECEGANIVWWLVKYSEYEKLDRLIEMGLIAQKHFYSVPVAGRYKGINAVCYLAKTRYIPMSLIDRGLVAREHLNLDRGKETENVIRLLIIRNLWQELSLLLKNSVITIEILSDNLSVFTIDPTEQELWMNLLETLIKPNERGQIEAWRHKLFLMILQEKSMLLATAKEQKSEEAKRVHQHYTSYTEAARAMGSFFYRPQNMDKNVDNIILSMATGVLTENPKRESKTEPTKNFASESTAVRKEEKSKARPGDLTEFFIKKGAMEVFIAAQQQLVSEWTRRFMHIYSTRRKIVLSAAAKKQMSINIKIALSKESRFQKFKQCFLKDKKRYREEIFPKIENKLKAKALEAKTTDELLSCDELADIFDEVVLEDKATANSSTSLSSVTSTSNCQAHQEESSSAFKL